MTAGGGGDQCRWIASICLLVASPFYVVCTLTHCCVCGHMKHGPYPAWYFVNDAIWVAGFFIATVAGAGSNLWCRNPLLLALPFLMLARLGGAVPVLLELPLVAALVVSTIVDLFAKATKERAVGQDVLPRARRGIGRWLGVCAIGVACAALVCWVWWFYVEIFDPLCP